MTEPPNKLYDMVLKNGATRDREEFSSKASNILKGNAVRLFLAQRGLCFHCATPMSFHAYMGRRQNRGFSFEHINPRRFGGGGGDNIVLAHGSCNHKRDLRPFTEAELKKRDEIWVIAATFDEVVICRMARNMDLRGKRFEESWLNYRGGFSDGSW